MGEWTKCGKGFIEARARWQEGVFEEKLVPEGGDLEGSGCR